MTHLDRPTVALVRLAAAIANGADAALRARARAAIEAQVPMLWVDELLLQSILMVGYPRALTAAGVWREAVGVAAESLEDGADRGLADLWAARGEATCRTIYGANYEKLRRNVVALHPAIDAWMVAEGYGRTLSRPGLDLVRREFCVVAQVTVLEAERQLHSHLRGALNAGADRAAVEALFEAIEPEVGSLKLTKAQALWERMGR